MVAGLLPFLLLALASSWQPAPVSAADYTYEEFNTAGVRNSNGPSRWGEIRDSTTAAIKYPNCAAGELFGQLQSPIDLSPQSERTSSSLEGAKGLAVSHPSLRAILAGATSSSSSSEDDDLLQLGSAQNTFTVTNDGAQMRVMFPSTNEGLPTFRDPMAVTTSAQSISYVMSEISFHAVSDHVVAGSRSDFEIQIVFDKRQASATTASGGSTTSFSQTPNPAGATDGTTATTTGEADHIIISILMDACLYCSQVELAKFWHVLPHWNISTATTTTAAVIAEVVPADNIAVNIRNLLPSTRDYATYMGGRTFPPCSPNVRYYVFTPPENGGGGHLGVSYAQIEHFKKVMGWKTSTYDFNPQVSLAPYGNYRPLVASSTAIPAGSIARFKDIGSPADVDTSRTQSVYYDRSQDEEGDLATAARPAAFVGIILGFFSTVISVAAIYQTIQRSAASSSGGTHGGGAASSSSSANGGDGGKGAGGKMGGSSVADKYRNNNNNSGIGGKEDMTNDGDSVSQQSTNEGGYTPKHAKMTLVDRSTKVQRFTGASPTPNGKEHNSSAAASKSRRR